MAGVLKWKTNESVDNWSCKTFNEQHKEKERWLIQPINIHIFFFQIIFQQQVARFPNSNIFALQLHEKWFQHINIWRIKVQNDVIRLSIDLLDLSHKGSVTVNRHGVFLFLKIETTSCRTASTAGVTVHDNGLFPYWTILSQGHTQAQLRFWFWFVWELWRLLMIFTVRLHRLWSGRISAPLLCIP